MFCTKLLEKKDKLENIIKMLNRHVIMSKINYRNTIMEIQFQELGCELMQFLLTNNLMSKASCICAGIRLQKGIAKFLKSVLPLCYVLYSLFVSALPCMTGVSITSQKNISIHFSFVNGISFQSIHLTENENEILHRCNHLCGDL